MLSWKHSGFSADASVRVETIADAVRLGRYMIRSPLVLERLYWDADRGEVTYQARPKRSKGPSVGIARWDVLEFIARATDHIPETRARALYSNSSRPTTKPSNPCGKSASSANTGSGRVAGIAPSPPTSIVDCSNRGSPSLGARSVRPSSTLLFPVVVAGFVPRAARSAPPSSPRCSSTRS